MEPKFAENRRRNRLHRLEMGNEEDNQRFYPSGSFLFLPLQMGIQKFTALGLAFPELGATASPGMHIVQFTRTWWPTYILDFWNP